MIRISNLLKQMQFWHLFSQIVFPFVNLLHCKIFTGSSVNASEPALVRNNQRQLYFSGTMKHIVFRIKLAQAWNEAFVLHGSLTMEEANFKRNDDSSVYTGVSFCNHLSTMTKDKKSLAHERHKKNRKSPNNPKKQQQTQSKKRAIWLKLENGNKT